MFKKLKDKLTEEVKIPSQKFTQSMQQLAQAVVSPVSSNNSTYDTASNDNFSIDGDFDDTPLSSPNKRNPSEGGVAYRGGQATSLGNSFDSGTGAGFTHVDLQQDSSLPRTPSGPGASFNDTLSSLRSSRSSLASDSSFMFPVLESTGPTYNFQSDLESCSEASESVGPNINKEQLLIAYQKTQQKYHKYKGRYTDLARHYRDLERDNKNAKHVLTECQDKALRRMAELKEQCNLEKQAKAHLEEALRSDLEERDHLIHTLKTKYCDAELQIKLLRNQADQVQAQEVADDKPPAAEKLSRLPGQEDLLTGGDSGPTDAVLTPEPVTVESDNALKEKLKKLESLLHKCKEDITNKRENIKQLEADKHAAKAKIESLQQQLITIQKREEEASLSLAKNKQTIHRELESKEEEIKKLGTQLASSNARISELQIEVAQIKEDSKKELIASKIEAAKISKAEIEELVLQNKNLESHVAMRDNECKAHEKQVSELVERLEQSKLELDPLKKERDEIVEKLNQEKKQLHEKISELQYGFKNIAEKGISIEKLKPLLLSVQQLNGFHKQLKTDVVNIQSDNLAWIMKQTQTTQENLQHLMADMTEKHERTLSELDEYKKESMNAKESLATVNNKFVLLEQTLSKEKSGVESKMTDLEKELVEAERKIAGLEQSIEAEKSLRHNIERESSTNLELLQRKLDEERSRSQQAFDESSSSDLKRESEVGLLKEQMKQIEEEKAKCLQDYMSMKEKVDSLLDDVAQLELQLGNMESRNNEVVSDCESLKKLLDEKKLYVTELETTFSKLKEEDDKKTSELSQVIAEKTDLEQKLKCQENEFIAKLSAMKKKLKETAGALKENQEKRVTESDDYEKEMKALQDENKERIKEIASLQSIIKINEEKQGSISASEIALQKELEETSAKSKEQASIVSTLRDSNETLCNSLQQLKSELDSKSTLICELESINANLQKTLENKSEQSSQLAQIEEQLQVKTTEYETLANKLETMNTSQFQLEQMLQARTSECNTLIEEVGKLNLTQSETKNLLQLKSEDCLKLTSQLETLTTNLSSQNRTLEEKLKECEKYQRKISEMEREGAVELNNGKEESAKLVALVNSLETDKLELTHLLETKNGELESLANQIKSMKQEHEEMSKIVKEKTNECTNLAAQLEALTFENAKTSKLLKQKTIDCDDKEAQLDNLADEMKRVEELSQELHRINDDRDANVEVLSVEASNLALKVEELTVTTQELKEREVDLLGKLQAAQDLETDFIALQQREEAFLSKLDELKLLEKDLNEKEKDLMVKSMTIQALEEENVKLKEAGQNLSEIIHRAKEAEAKCEKLQEEGASVLLRIQKAEESEVRCSQLVEELAATKKEKEELLQELEFLQAKKVFKGNTGEEKSSDSSSKKEPVVEELCVVKKYADLTERNQSLEDEDAAFLRTNEWQEKYTQLLEQHHKVLQENAEVIERLKEEAILAARDNNMKQKERLWDRQDALASLPDGSTNGSFGAVEKLQQQLAAVTSQLKECKKVHRQEVDDLRRILLNHGSSNSRTPSRSDNLEDATELEYLRNILFEYMMGKEPMILARVIAAVVKFDSDQTDKVLQKEQQRLSLLGHLGIS